MKRMKLNWSTRKRALRRGRSVPSVAPRGCSTIVKGLRRRPRRDGAEPIAASSEPAFLNTMFYFYSSLVSDSGDSGRTVPALHREGAAQVKMSSNGRYRCV
jgi:hypothetical protein